MKFTLHVDINAPIDKVVELHQNPNNREKWQDGYIESQHVSGQEGRPGAKSLLKYEKFDLTETIIINNLPDEFTGLYEHKHMTNTMSSYFSELPNGNTRYTSEVEYTKISHLLVKVMSWIMPGMFKKQVLKWMTQFKAFVESV